MAFLDDTETLEDILGRSADNSVNTIGQQYAKKRRQAISQQANAGRLGSGVANYTFGDIDAAQASDEGDIYANLAGSLGQIPINDYTTTREDERQRELARLLAELNKPSALEEALGAVGAVGNIAGNIGATFAAF